MSELRRSAWSMRRRSLPSPKKCSWPMNSSIVRGRMRAASGRARRRFSSRTSAKRSLMAAPGSASGAPLPTVVADRLLELGPSLAIISLFRGRGDDQLGGRKLNRDQVTLGEPTVELQEGGVDGVLAGGCEGGDLGNPGRPGHESARGLLADDDEVRHGLPRGDCTGRPYWPVTKLSTTAMRLEV